MDSTSSPPHRSSHVRFNSRTRPQWNNNWPFENEEENKPSTSDPQFPSMSPRRGTMDNPFMMFEMLTRAVFDKFLNDDLFWNHFDGSDASSTARSQGIHFPNLNTQQPPRGTSSRLRSASQQRAPTSTTRTRINVNHVPSSKTANEMHFEWLGHQGKQKRTASSSRYDQRDSDEENLDENYVYRQPKPSSINVQRLRRRTTNPTEPKNDTCQFCFLPFINLDTRLQHEAMCRHRTTKPASSYRTKSHPAAPTSTNTGNATEKLFTSKCSYCHQEVRLSNRVDHEALCKQFGAKRQTTTGPKRFPNPMSSSVNGDSQYPPKSSSGNKMKQASETSPVQ